MSAPQPISLADKLAGISDHWNPRIVAGYNGNELRLVKLAGDFTWHSHPDTDELFLVLKGQMRILFRDGVAELGEGDLLVVPRGVEHCPQADAECHALLIDREGEPNTGDTPSHRTRTTLERA
ncbi:mannose-6-phosphate isomerase [Sandarakinorhabdus cyanobacteriorum]|uniref:Mannose-6-phosphate isomerase n=1 Tax=Sandarakinorhabdus cyanobacteriorum TaxID=1981098 RepID=A0A255YDA3_9SPHN|nr:cupin domain-containing protein [Sandarakinorhabdus cyanobacteriorum]OYQ27216.1 mannose-6-phosphate isomerase [Sandarakinorhabdus cyanobacteriorum]